MRDWSSEMEEIETHTIGYSVTLSRGTCRVKLQKVGSRVRCLRERVSEDGVAEAKVMGA